MVRHLGCRSMMPYYTDWVLYNPPELCLCRYCLGDFWPWWWKKRIDVRAWHGQFVTNSIIQHFSTILFVSIQSCRGINENSGQDHRDHSTPTPLFDLIRSDPLHTKWNLIDWTASLLIVSTSPLSTEDRNEHQRERFRDEGGWATGSAYIEVLLQYFYLDRVRIPWNSFAFASGTPVTNILLERSETSVDVNGVVCM